MKLPISKIEKQIRLPVFPAKPKTKDQKKEENYIM